MQPSRRTCLTVAAMALAGSLAAQPSQQRRYVVASFVGDKLAAVGAAVAFA
jgi:hypothetical protein